ncbi:hypothetical protein MJN85_27490, partial [Salmonella enterica subsp. enterica serovar Anatum]|nr:hypothetical protein [Salmonella enterica subsp. enterica serovar Anatum]
MGCGRVTDKDELIQENGVAIESQLDEIKNEINKDLHKELNKSVIGIIVSQFLAGRSDKKGDRKKLIVFCCVLGMLACVLFAWNR